ncbi:flagellar biosynthetic protein FliO [Dongshaea marina]|uniref:flagellar biosynthetic protein FliO n=1 Tax=Dongshaea marina TaxID=2047966 RepID=UPI000D3E3439|nr:flagellar biosynthetic protein FliO [Dongshaea marina]
MKKAVIAWALMAFPVLAAPETTSMVNWLFSSVLVVVIIFMLAWLLKKTRLVPNSAGQIKVVSAMPLGSKERLVVVQIKETQYLLGVTAHQINLLEKLDEPITREAPEFAQTLNKFLKKS